MFDSHQDPSLPAVSPGDGQRRKSLRPSGARWGALVGAALLSGLLLIPEAAFAGRNRGSAPSDSSSKGSNVSRADAPSSGSASRTRSGSGSSARSSGSRSSNPRTSASSRGSSSGSAPVRVTRPGTRDRVTPPSDSGDYPTRIENRRGYDGRYYDRGKGRGYYGDRYYRGNYYIGYYGPYWAYWPYWGNRYYWDGYWGGYWGPPPVYYTTRSGDLGGLDLDVSPEKAEIYLDGHYIGVADDFDGFPAYLWLEPGTYDLVFYKEGYGTEARRYKILPGLIIDVEDEMISGTSVSPDEALTAWVEAEGEIPARQERRERYADRDDRDRPEDRYDEWEERRERRRVERDEMESSASARPAPRGSADAGYDARQEPGRLALRLTPGDASVYLDGRFLGTARELAEVSAGLIVDPGPHVLELVRPGYRSDRAEFEVESGEQVTVELSLEEETGR